MNVHGLWVAMTTDRKHRCTVAADTWYQAIKRACSRLGGTEPGHLVARRLEYDDLSIAQRIQHETEGTPII